MRDRPSKKQIVVVGCGVIGLASAVRLQEEGYGVRIVARDLPPHTTSNRAAAIWRPYRAAPEVKVVEWAERTYHRYRAEYDDPASEVYEVELVEASREEARKPSWIRPHHRYRTLGRDELPRGYRHGFGIRVPFVHSRRYLDRLLATFTERGGKVERRPLRSLADVADGVHAIVNCSGLGARELVPDPDVFGIRGQLAVVSLDRPARHFLDMTGFRGGPLYVLPRGDECFLGGTAEENCESLEEDLVTRRELLSRCAEIGPALADSGFLRSIVGVRPARSEVRLERDREWTDPIVVHNYGHGGSGFTVAWGCADEVARILAS